MIIHRNLIQGTDEWLAIRELKLTASHGTAIGNNGAGLKTLVNKLIIGAIKPQENYISKDMERGNELEPIARIKYIYETKIPIVEVGFITHTEHSGCSPDGIYEVGGKIIGGIEIKARNDEKHYKILTTGKIDSETLWQIYMTMFITGAKWWDFISYNPNYSGKNSMFIKRIFPDIKKSDQIYTGINTGTDLLISGMDNDIFKAERKLILDSRNI